MMIPNFGKILIYADNQFNQFSNKNSLKKPNLSQFK